MVKMNKTDKCWRSDSYREAKSDARTFAILSGEWRQMTNTPPDAVRHWGSGSYFFTGPQDSRQIRVPGMIIFTGAL